MTRLPLADEIAVVRSLCHRLGLNDSEPTLLKAAHHTTLLIAPAAIVARVQSAEPLDTSWARAQREVAIAGHGAASGAIALAPLAGLSGPHAVGSVIVTLWPYVDHQRVADEADASLAAAALDALHTALRHYPGELPSFSDALDRCALVLAGPRLRAALPYADRDVLTAQFRRLRRLVEQSAAAWTPLHGDAHPGNLLIREGGAVWIDLEDACRGPREYDIAALPQAAWPRFAGVDQALVRVFADLRSICVAIWCWADPSRSAAVREAAEHHLDCARALPR